MAKPTKSSTKPGAAHTPGLHYSKEAVLADYRATFRMFMVMLMVGIGGALVYFFGMIIYLGGWSHTKTDAFVKEFPTIAQEYGYKGLKLPEYTDPSILDKEPAKANGAH